MSSAEPTTDEPGVKPDPTPEPTNTPTPDPAPAEPSGTDDLVKMREALAKERSLRSDAERRAKAGNRAQEELEKLQAASRSDLEKAVDAARKEGAQTVLATSNDRLIRAEARALAAEARFRNPQLVVRALDLAGITVTDDGVVDSAAITVALKALAADEPYLVDDGQPRTPRKDPSQGSGKAPAPKGAEKGIAEAQRRFGKAAT